MHKIISRSHIKANNLSGSLAFIRQPLVSDLLCTVNLNVVAPLVVTDATINSDVSILNDTGTSTTTTQSDPDAVYLRKMIFQSIIMTRFLHHLMYVALVW